MNCAILLAVALFGQEKPPLRIGDCLVVGLPGVALDSKTKAALASGRIAGVLVMGRNIRSLEELQTLTRDAKAAAHEGGYPHPILCIDQEGGTVNRLRKIPSFPKHPSAAALARMKPPDRAKTLQGVCAFLAETGLNMNLAPCADLYQPGVIGSRSYGAKPAQVVQAASEAIKASSEFGVASIVKHYPGHGLTNRDSHGTLPRVKATKAKMEKHEGVFVALMETSAAGVMVGHLLVPSIDKKWPASLSEIHIGRLREISGSDRLIITDSGAMSALRRYGSEAARAGRALTAGADIYLTTTVTSKSFAELARRKVYSRKRMLAAAARVRAWRESLAK